MMRSLRLALTGALTLAVTLALAPLAFAADDARIAEGIRLHELGKYDEAAALYRAVLADDPGNELATYELGLTFQAQGKYPECRATIEPLSKKKGTLQVRALTMLGNCLDHGGDRKAAIAAYKRAVKLAPEDTNVLYNYAVTSVRAGQLDEARKLLKKELLLAPHHPGGHHALATVFQHQGFRAAAVLSYLRFLGYELGTARSREAAQNLLALLNLGVERSNDGKNVTITVNPKTRTEEGDFGTWELMLAIAAGARDIKEGDEAKSEFEKTREQIHTSLKMLLESAKPGRDYTSTQNVPFFAALEKEELLGAYAGVALLPLDLPGEAEWTKANGEAVQKLVAYFRRGK